jgi:sec-independent protein translocase protein TatC
MNFSASFSSSQLRPVIGLSSFLRLTGWLAFAFGIMFQFPIAVILAVRFNLVKPSFLRSKRPYIIAIILIFATILTPPDVLSRLLLAIPTYLLFEIGLFLSRMFEKKESSDKPARSKNLTMEFLIFI